MCRDLVGQEYSWTKSRGRMVGYRHIMRAERISFLYKGRRFSSCTDNPLRSVFALFSSRRLANQQLSRSKGVAINRRTTLVRNDAYSLVTVAATCIGAEESSDLFGRNQLIAECTKIWAKVCSGSEKTRTSRLP